MSTLKYAAALGVLTALISACQPKAEDSASGKSLYVASGLCYSGGNTTFTAATASNIIFKINLDTGVHEDSLADYNVVAEPSGSTPVYIQNYDDNYLMAMIENATSTGSRRLELIPKSATSQVATKSFLQNSTILSSALAAFKILDDGSLFISRSTGLEKVTAAGARLYAQPGNLAWLSATTGSCQSNTKITAIDYIGSSTAGSNYALFAHAAAGQMKIGFIKTTGYVTAADCLATKTSPVATAAPSAMVYLADEMQAIVAYAGTTTTTDVNSIYVYDVDTTGNTISAGTKLYENTGVVFGASAMTYDKDTHSLYVATSTSNSSTITGYNIEKFTYDSSAKTLTRVGTTPFSSHSYKTKCISSMFIK